MDPRERGTRRVQAPPGQSYQGNKGDSTVSSKQSNGLLFSQFCFTFATSLKCSILGSSPMGVLEVLGPGLGRARCSASCNASREKSEMRDQRDVSPTSSSVHLTQKKSMDKGGLLLRPRCKPSSRVWEIELFNSKHPLPFLHPNSEQVHTVRVLRLSFIAGCKMLWFYL